MKSLSLSRPHMIILVGIPGSGKSFFAEKFAATFGTPLVSTAAIRSILKSSLDHDRSADSKIVSLMVGQIIKTKQTFVYDGDTHTRTGRQKLVDMASKLGYKPVLLWVQTDTLSARLRATKARDHGRFTSDEFDRAVRVFQAPDVKEKPIVVSGKHTFASQLKIVLSHLTSPRPTQTTSARTSARQIAVR